MFESGVPQADVAKYCLTFIGKTIKKMTAAAFAELGEMPVVYAGGVMSDMYIKEMLENGSKIDLSKILENYDVVISDEIGNGIIPVDQFERDWREQTGRICCYIVSQSRKVVRLTGGIPVIIKDESK